MNATVGQLTLRTMLGRRRAMLYGNSSESRAEFLSQANKLTRTYAIALDALNRHRGKGQQKMTVEHVQVYAGGQAVVGVVNGMPAGEGVKTEVQPYAEITHAPQQEMRSPDQEREALPVRRDAERPLPHARQTIAGRAKGK